MTRKKSFKKKPKSKKNLQNQLYQFFHHHPQKKVNIKQLSKKLQLSETWEEVRHAVYVLQSRGVVESAGEDRFMLHSDRAKSESYQVREGRVDIIRSGAAYIIPEDGSTDIFVPAKHLNHALNGDLVKVRTTGSSRNKPFGEILEVIRRQQDQFVGTVISNRKQYFVLTDNPLIPFDIVLKEFPDDIELDDKIIVQITDWKLGRNQVAAKYLERLDIEDVNDYNMKSILLRQGFSVNFPSEVEEEVAEINPAISAEEIQKRRDFRSVLTFTIDPKTAKDFDDALSYQVLDNGLIEVGVHIADVTHYVRPHTALDQEAYRRSTSVYLVDRVAPMLPEKLSNDLCSLNPHEDKLTFSAVFTFDQKLNVTSSWFGRTIIHSDHRFTYEDAQEVIENKTNLYRDQVVQLNKIAKRLRQQNIRHGAIQFETDEVQFELNDKNEPIGVFVKERKDAHLLIEDFMLLANREVARYIAEKGKEHEIPFIYRVHDLPDIDKLNEFSIFVRDLGYELQTQTPQQIAKSLNAIQEAAQKDPILKMLAPIAIRTMAKAVYTTNNIGHFGLGFSFYTHFTSPIRRYADVLAHRILAENLDQTFREKKSRLEDQCKHISTQERKAIDAERESISYKQAEYMARHVGESFIGYISGIIERGIFVSLADSKCEGLVRFDSMNEGFSVADHRLRAMGLHSGKVYSFGDEVKVRIISADPDRREIDMVIDE
ncbi:MAG: ribonuclease R [Saprospiraceae bacterium]|nr:ribonuclease R [Saprospiraceae bacterium]